MVIDVNPVPTRSGHRGNLQPRPPLERLAHCSLAARYGRTGVAPFLANADITVVDLQNGHAAGGYSQQRRWAVTPGDVVSPPALAELALSEYLDVVARRRLRPVFVGVSDPHPYAGRGLDVVEIAEEAVIELAGFSLAGSKRANLRHSTTSARRAGLVVEPYAPAYGRQIADISREWLRTKRGGEMGFTLSRHDDIATQISDRTTDLWVVRDGGGIVQAWCSFRHYLGGRGRVIDVMRRRTGAPNPAMDALIATVLENYRDQGVALASLASVPREHGAMAERIYPCRSLRAYKNKFNPRWEPRWLAIPAARQRLFALSAVGSAYSPGGMRRALLHNR